MTTSGTGSLLSMRAALLAMQEQGITHLTEEQARQIAGGHADGIIDRAQEIEAADRQADQARETIAAVATAVDSRIDDLHGRLYDEDSPHHISEDSHAIRYEARTELQFLRTMQHRMVSLEPGGTLDLSESDMGYRYNPLEIAAYAQLGQDHMSVSERERAEHTANVERASGLIRQLEDAGVTVDTSFHIQHREPIEATEISDRTPDREAQTESAYYAGLRGEPLPSDAMNDGEMMKTYEEGLKDHLGEWLTWDPEDAADSIPHEPEWDGKEAWEAEIAGLKKSLSEAKAALRETANDRQAVETVSRAEGPNGQAVNPDGINTAPVEGEEPASQKPQSQ